MDLNTIEEEEEEDMLHCKSVLYTYYSKKKLQKTTIVPLCFFMILFNHSFIDTRTILPNQLV